MNTRLKVSIIVAALQLIAVLPPAGRAALAATLKTGATAGVDGRAPAPRSGETRRGRKGAPKVLPAGVWGGERVRLEVGERGASVEYDCARESVEEAIMLDARGRFSVKGTHYEEHGGPVRADEASGGYPVRLSGQVRGDVMRLTVTRAGARKPAGTYTLVRGRDSNIVKCR